MTRKTTKSMVDFLISRTLLITLLADWTRTFTWRSMNRVIKYNYSREVLRNTSATVYDRIIITPIEFYFIG